MNKKNLKYIISIILVLIVALTLGACKKENNKDKESVDTEGGLKVEESGVGDSASFEDLISDDEDDKRDTDNDGTPDKKDDDDDNDGTPDTKDDDDDNDGTPDVKDPDHSSNAGSDESDDKKDDNDKKEDEKEEDKEDEIEDDEMQFGPLF